MIDHQDVAERRDMAELIVAANPSLQDRDRIHCLFTESCNRPDSSKANEPVVVFQCPDHGWQCWFGFVSEFPKETKDKKSNVIVWVNQRIDKSRDQFIAINLQRI